MLPLLAVTSLISKSNAHRLKTFKPRPLPQPRDQRLRPFKPPHAKALIAASLRPMVGRAFAPACL
jgi:hypothetical protein